MIQLNWTMIGIELCILQNLNKNHWWSNLVKIVPIYRGCFESFIQKKKNHYLQKARSLASKLRALWLFKKRTQKLENHQLRNIQRKSEKKHQYSNFDGGLPQLIQVKWYASCWRRNTLKMTQEIICRFNMFRFCKYGDHCFNKQKNI